LPQTSPPEIDHVQTDAVILELLKRSGCISRGAKCAVEFCGNDNVARLQHLEHALAFAKNRRLWEKTEIPKVA
jgi:hypothetical protein